MKNKEKQKNGERNFNIDLVRIVAFFFVIAIHFYMNTFYYTEQCEGVEMFVMTIFRTLFITCVPLFLLITGYLMNKKTLSRKYYKSLIRIFMIYFLCSVACICFKILYMNHNISIKESVFEILGFKGAPYSWYIEMYFGLFLLIPFINLIWNNLKDKRQRQWLLVTLFILTILPSFLNGFDWMTKGYFLNPWISETYQKIVPSWWVMIYPLTYYFMGAYIDEYDIKISVIKNGILLVFFVLLFGTISFVKSLGKNFILNGSTDYFGVGAFSIAILLFILLLHIDLRKIPKFFKGLIVGISNLSLAAYLMSYISDKLVYTPILLNSDSIIGTFKFFVPAVFGVFFLSLIFAAVIELLYRLFYRVGTIVYQNIVKKQKLK